MDRVGAKNSGHASKQFGHASKQFDHASKIVANDLIDDGSHVDCPHPVTLTHRLRRLGIVSWVPALRNENDI